MTEVVTATDGRKASTTQRVVMKDYVIVSLGDSYTSGEGNPDIPLGLNAAGQVVGPVWENARTELSANAGPAQMALAIERSDPHSSVTFLSFAGAGASIPEGLLGPYDSVNPPTGPPAPLPSQLEQVLQVLYPHRTSPAAHPRLIDALIVSVGGNDLHFTDIAEAALNPQISQLSDQPGLVHQLASDLAALPGRYDQLGAAIRADFPGLVKHVDLTEYPDPTHDASGGFSSGTGIYSGFTAAKARWTYQHVEVPLQTEMRQAAARNGWTYVGGIASGSRRHGITAGTGSWFVDPIQSLLEQGNINGTLHPNARGQQLIRDRLLAVVRPRLSFKARG